MSKLPPALPVSPLARATSVYCQSGAGTTPKVTFLFASLEDAQAAHAWATQAQGAHETTCSGWRGIDSRPEDPDATYLVTNGRQVAPWIRGVIHNNTGTVWDWEYGSNIIGWMPMPEPLHQKTSGNAP